VRVATHPRVFRKPWCAADAWQFVESLLASPSLGILLETERHASVASQVLKDVPLLAGNLLHDTHTAILMREHGVRIIYTRDHDFHRFPFLEIRDPLALL
jgi:predicted nucleic acid-binding protein